LARSLVQKRSPIIGVVIPELANPFFISIIDAIQTEAHKRELMVVIAQSERQEALEHKNINQFQQMRVAGAVVTPISPNLEHLQRLQAHGTKVIVVARQWHDGNYVTMDDYKGGYIVGEHLTRLGHRTIGCVSLNEPGNSAIQNRIMGFQISIEEAVGAYHRECLILTHTLHTDQGVQAADTFLELAEKPTAVFVTADHLAIGFVHRLLERGVRVPEDVAVVGYDDILYSEFLEVPLTTVALPKYKMGQLATQMLFEAMESGQDKTIQHQILLEPKLVIRSSCGARKKIS
jgi:LacI family transcriptional regulator